MVQVLFQLEYTFSNSLYWWSTPLIGLPFGSGDRRAARSARSGAVDFLSKPFNDECLIDCLGTALKSSNS